MPMASACTLHGLENTKKTLTSNMRLQNRCVCFPDITSGKCESHEGGVLVNGIGAF